MLRKDYEQYGLRNVMEGIDEKENLPLICIDFKYNKTKLVDDIGCRDHRKRGVTED